MFTVSYPVLVPWRTRLFSVALFTVSYPVLVPWQGCLSRAPVFRRSESPKINFRLALFCKNIFLLTCVASTVWDWSTAVEIACLLQSTHDWTSSRNHNFVQLIWYLRRLDQTFFKLKVTVKKKINKNKNGGCLFGVKVTIISLCLILSLHK